MSGVVVLKLYDTDPYFSKIRTYWEVSRFKTRDVYVGWPDPYSFRFGLFPRRGKSDFGTRHWYAVCQGHDIYLVFRICGKYQRTTYESRGSTNAFITIWSLMQLKFHDTERHYWFSQTKFHDTTRIKREFPWYVKFHCEIRCVKFHDTIRIKREIPGYVSFIVKFHGTKRISRVALGSFLKFFGMAGHCFLFQWNSAVR